MRKNVRKELMAKNNMEGLMFKMDADPRIIGSGPEREQERDLDIILDTFQ